MKFLSIFILFTFSCYAVDTCSRTALINYQEVMVDMGNMAKGEGLRFYLEKDEKAKALLDEYQEQNRPKAPLTIMSSIGSGLLLFSFFQNHDPDGKKRDFYLLSGASTILISFLIAKTLTFTSESKFEAAIEQYNKRHFPKIILKKNDQENNIDIGIGIDGSF